MRPEKEALPTPPDRVAEATTLAPSRNWTVPVGVPKLDGVPATVALKVIGWPKTEAPPFAGAVSVVVLLPAVTKKSGPESSAAA